jgi:hypothetical protein
MQRVTTVERACFGCLRVGDATNEVREILTPQNATLFFLFHQKEKTIL